MFHSPRQANPVQTVHTSAINQLEYDKVAAWRGLYTLVSGYQGHGDDREWIYMASASTPKVSGGEKGKFLISGRGYAVPYHMRAADAQGSFNEAAIILGQYLNAGRARFTHNLGLEEINRQQMKDILIKLDTSLAALKQNYRYRPFMMLEVLSDVPLAQAGRVTVPVFGGANQPPMIWKYNFLAQPWHEMADFVSKKYYELGMWRSCVEYFAHVTGSGGPRIFQLVPLLWDIIAANYGKATVTADLIYDYAQRMFKALYGDVLLTSQMRDEFLCTAGILQTQSTLKSIGGDLGMNYQIEVEPETDVDVAIPDAYFSEWGLEHSMGTIDLTALRFTDCTNLALRIIPQGSEAGLGGYGNPLERYELDPWLMKATYSVGHITRHGIPVFPKADDKPYIFVPEIYSCGAIAVTNPALYNDGLTRTVFGKLDDPMNSTGALPWALRMLFGDGVAIGNRFYPLCCASEVLDFWARKIEGSDQKSYRLANGLNIFDGEGNLKGRWHEMVTESSLMLDVEVKDDDPLSPTFGRRTIKRQEVKVPAYPDEDMTINSIHRIVKAELPVRNLDEELLEQLQQGIWLFFNSKKGTLTNPFPKGGPWKVKMNPADVKEEAEEEGKEDED